ncbi:hypothetical protein BHM03_00005386 [Ensete ventricosum]|nr:hypothetical protein BHM03_00005386 [Ensete ventricosum]
MHLNAYYARYEKYHVCYGGDEETRKANYGDMVCYIHRQGESLRESIKRHEHFLALQVGLKPGMKVYLHSPFIFIYCYDQGLSYRPIPAYRVYLGMTRLRLVPMWEDEASPRSHARRRGVALFPRGETRSHLIFPWGDEESPRSPARRRGVASFSRDETSRLVLPREDEALPHLISPTDRTGNWGSSLFSPFSSSPPSSFSLNRPPTAEINRRRLILTVSLISGSTNQNGEPCSTSITGLNNNEYQISRGTVTDIFPTNIILQELNRIAGVSESCNFVKVVSEKDLAVKTLEFVGIAPAGSNRVSSFLEKAAEGLVEGGRKEIFTPMYFFLVRKPPSDS